MSNRKQFLWMFIPVFVVGSYFFLVFKYSWWGGDDPCLIFAVKKLGLVPLVTTKELWAAYVSPSNFTPWIMVDYWIDYMFFGLNPIGYYSHVLISSIVLISLIVYILNHYYNIPVSISCVLLACFLVTYPFREVFTSIYTKHYLEGLIFSCLSFLFLLRKRYLLASVFYFMACLSKEIFVPMIVFILAVRMFKFLIFDWKNIFYFITFFVFYMFCRFYLLGYNILQGYSYTTALSLKDVIKLPLVLLNISGMSYVIFIFIILILIYAMFDKRKFYMLLLLGVLSLFPLSFVADIKEYRYFFLPIFLLYIGGCFSINFIFVNKKNLTCLFMLVICLISFGGFVKNIGFFSDYLRTRYMEGSFFYDPPKRVKNENSFLFNVILPSWHFVCLRDLVPRKYPKICVDPYLCSKIYGKATFWRYDYNFKSVTRFKPCKVQEVRNSVLAEILFDPKRMLIKWRFSPFKDGSYYLLSIYPWGIGGNRSILPSGTYKIFLRDLVPFIVKFVSSKGWVAYSKVMKPMEKDGLVIWRSF